MSSSESASAKPKKKGGIKWDEDNLDYNEKHKSATMKITEPKTPFLSHTLPEDAEINKTLEDIREKDKVGYIVQPEVVQEAVEKYGSAVAAEFYENRKEKQAANEWDEDDEEEDESANVEPYDEKKFREKRKQHYNEYLLLKKMREEHPEDFDEEDSGSASASQNA